MGNDEFRASNGWLENFKKRHGIVYRKVCGESGAVDDNVCAAWKAELQSVIQGYSPHDVFNADETALFFKCLPDSTMTFKGEKCQGGKLSKERLTVLLATNASGTEKLRPLVIGKSRKPRCFAGCKSFPVDYTSNKKAWMNSNLFSDWLKDLDKKMTRANRKILLFIDNCPAHNIIPPLVSVEVKFFPPNTTSKLQALDQGIIKNAKVLYRHEVVRKTITNIEDGKPASINVLDAMRMLDKAWRNVKESTIVNGFRTCGFRWTGEGVMEVSFQVTSIFFIRYST